MPSGKVMFRQLIPQFLIGSPALKARLHMLGALDVSG
jgi:hypothetical protein